MKCNILKSRYGKLTEKLKFELKSQKPNLDKILEYVNEFEKDNLNTIEKLRKEKLYETKRISGALKQTINAHGPITPNFIGSATKRIYGSLLHNGSKEHNQYVKIHKATLLLGLMLVLTTVLFLIFNKIMF